MAAAAELKRAQTMKLTNTQESFAILNKLVRTGVNVSDEEAVRIKEQCILELGSMLSKVKEVRGLQALIVYTRPFLNLISKAKAESLVRALVDFYFNMNMDTGAEARLLNLYYDKARYTDAIALASTLLKELKKVDDKQLLGDVQLIESKTYFSLGDVQQSRSALIRARRTSYEYQSSRAVRAELDLQTGVIHASIDDDFKTAHFYFHESFGVWDSLDDKRAIIALKYTLLSKIMLNSAADVISVTSGKLAAKYGGKELEAMISVAKAICDRNLVGFQKASKKYKKELVDDAITFRHLDNLYRKLKETFVSDVAKDSNDSEQLKVEGPIGKGCGLTPQRFLKYPLPLPIAETYLQAVPCEESTSLSCELYGGFSISEARSTVTIRELAVRFPVLREIIEKGQTLNLTFIKRAIVDLLGIPATSPSEDFRSCFQLLKLKLHPDKNPNDINAPKRFDRLLQYQTLFDLLEDPEVFDRLAFDGFAAGTALSSPHEDLIQDASHFAPAVDTVLSMNIPCNFFVRFFPALLNDAVGCREKRVGGDVAKGIIILAEVMRIFPENIDQGSAGECHTPTAVFKEIFHLICQSLSYSDVARLMRCFVAMEWSDKDICDVLVSDARPMWKTDFRYQVEYFGRAIGNALHLRRLPLAVRIAECFCLPGICKQLVRQFVLFKKVQKYDEMSGRKWDLKEQVESATSLVKRYLSLELFVLANLDKRTRENYECPMRYDACDFHDLKDVMNSRHGNRNCRMRLFSREELDRHYKTFHPNLQVIRCRACGMNYPLGIAAWEIWMHRIQHNIYFTKRKRIWSSTWLLEGVCKERAAFSLPPGYQLPIISIDYRKQHFLDQPVKFTKDGETYVSVRLFTL